MIVIFLFIYKKIRVKRGYGVNMDKMINKLLPLDNFKFLRFFKNSINM